MAIVAKITRSDAVDDTDRRLVEELRLNARATYAELARVVGLSAASVHDRVRRLETNGTITGYHAAVAPEALDLGVTALVSVYQTDSADREDVADALRGVPELADCWFVAGDEAFVVKVRVADVDALERTLGALWRVPGVAHTRTTVVLSTRWEDRINALPRGPQDAPPADGG